MTADNAASKPRLLDLFCGAGGAAVGYSRAGFEVVGVDIKPQPHYPFEFYQRDALDCLRDLDLRDPLRFDAIHASPVCHAWSQMRLCRPGNRDDKPDYIAPLRPLLKATGLPWVMENVPGAPLENPVRICGTGLGLKVQRHREFETSFACWGVPCAHGQNAWDPRYGHSTGRKRRRVPVIGEWRIRPELQFEAMGIDWMTLEELTEAIPPAYTEHIGRRLLEQVRARVNADIAASVKHRLMRVDPTPPDDKMPEGGMSWTCTCGAVGWSAADIAELTWYEHANDRR